jgi:DtxR family transcriptional regulator, Mn-dependent transcriptional regulator
MNVNDLHDKFPAAADYLSQIFLIERDYREVTNLRLSERLGVSKPAVTQSIKRLSKLGLVHQDRYGTILLTDEGREIAKAVLERHYLLEHVLVDMLDFPWEKSDREAKQLQVIISDELKAHLREKLGNPETCPHGNPFPDSKIERELVEASRLIDALVGDTITLLRITEEGEEVDGLLAFCFAHNLRPGTVLALNTRTADGLEVQKKKGRSAHPAAGASPSSRSVNLRGKDSETFLIPLHYARHFCYSAG